MKQVLHKLRKTDTKENEGTVSWKSPSNIALIKYWGKFGKQLPANPSLSFTLKNSVTQTTVHYKPKMDDGDVSIEFKFESEKNKAFADRIENYLNSIKSLFPLLTSHHLAIESENSFPHSSGIASSASSMSALAMCLVEIQNKLSKEALNKEDTLRLASYIARLGSGSASRSVYGGFTVWGKSKAIKGSSDLYAIPYPYEIHKEFQYLHDDILIVDEEKKEVSSSIGHSLLENHPFAKNRFRMARKRIHDVKNILISGDLESFGKLAEQEALMLHSLMMTSDPYFILFKPNTISIVNEVWRIRKEENLGIFFSMDAGANVHLIYRDQDAEKCRSFIENQLLAYCQNEQYLCDQLGSGPESVKG